MITWQSGVEVITLFVDDLQSSKAFYEHKLGLPIEYEDQDSVVLDCGNLSINLRSRTQSPAVLVPHPRSDVRPAPSVQITVDVDDLDEACTDLSSRGMTLASEPTERIGGFRNATFIDPDGYLWEVTQQLPQARSVSPRSDIASVSAA